MVQNILNYRSIKRYSTRIVELIDTEETYKTNSYKILNHIMNHTCAKGTEKYKEK